MKRALPLLLLLIAACSTTSGPFRDTSQEEYERWFNHYKTTYVTTGRFPQFIFEGPIRRRPEDQNEREAGGVNLLNDPQYRAWGDVRDKIGSAKLCPAAKPEMCVVPEFGVVEPQYTLAEEMARIELKAHLDDPSDPNNPFEPTPSEVVAELERMGYRPSGQILREERPEYRFDDSLMPTIDAHGKEEVKYGPIYRETRHRLELERRSGANPRYLRLQAVFAELDSLPAKRGASPELVTELTLALLGGPEESEAFPLRRADDRVYWALQDGFISEAGYRLYEDLKQPRRDEELSRILIGKFETVIDLCSSSFEAPRELREGLVRWELIDAAGRARGVEAAAISQLQRSRDRHYQFVTWHEVLERAKAEKRPAPEYRCAY